MDFLQTTGDRLHDLELDRILARLVALEAKAASKAPPTPATAAAAAAISAAAVGVRSITPGSGTQIQNDVQLASVGSLTLSQSGQAITMTVPVLVAGSNIALTPSGNNITIAASGGASSVPHNVLVVSCGASYINWAVPLALTELNALTVYRAKHDLTNATQARMVAAFPTPSSAAVSPTYAAQFSTDNGATWNYLDSVSGPAITYLQGVRASAWITLTALAKADVLLRVVGSGGDGSTIVPIGGVYVQAK